MNHRNSGNNGTGRRMRFKRVAFTESIVTRLIHVLLSHLTAMFAVLIIICFIIDCFNTAMEFMTSDLSRWMIAVLAVLALATSVMTIVTHWIDPDKKSARSNRDDGSR